MAVYDAACGVAHQPGEASAQSKSISAEGGTVTLPDGTRIEVAAVSKYELWQLAEAATGSRLTRFDGEMPDVSELCAAFNGAKGATRGAA